jgi:PAS domain S-box-containing protein
MNTILFVARNDTLASADAQLLKSAGYTVLTARSGIDAAAACNAGDRGIDLILMDVDPGADMEALRTAETILRDHDLPIVFYYATEAPSLLGRMTTVRSYGSVPKESRPVVFTTTIETALSLHRTHLDQTRTIASLRESQQQHGDLIEKMPDGVYKSTHEGKFIEVNPAMVNILGYDSKEELCSIDIKTELYFAPADRESAALEEKLEEMAVFRLRKKDGSEVWVEDHGSHVVDEHGTVLYHEGILRDVTERVRSERQLLQAQKLDGIGTLAGGIAHDFNNLLAMILGSAELLRKQTSENPLLKKYVDRIIEASERGASISRQLLIFSRPNQVELRAISLSHIILALEEMLQHFLPKTIVIETAIDADADIIMGDAGQIHQALLNLALNASDAMSGSGTMVIREGLLDEAMVRAKYPAQEAKQFIGVSISDTGIGIDASVIAKIFDPFFSTKERGNGTGLGLAIVHGIVKNHRGFIDVESTPGRGATFTLYFPVTDHTETAAPRKIVRPSAKTTGTILLVDDEIMIRELLTEFLEECGFVVMPASNGAEAIIMYEKYRTLIDLVITDLGMPEIGGEELYGHLKKIDEHVKVIVSSGYLDGSTKADLIGIGVKDVLTKPYKFDDILHVIRRVLRNGSGE